MTFQVSPGIQTNELDLTTVIPAVSSTEGAIAGLFRWGPVEELVLVDSEETLANRFGRPTNHNPETFFTAANFLAYGNKLFVSRGADAATNSAVAHTGSAPAAGANDIKNFDAKDGVTIDTQVHFVARHLGALGNSLKVSVCDTATAFSGNVTFLKTDVDTTITKTFIEFIPGAKTAILTMESSVSSAALDTAKGVVDTEFTVGDIIVADGQRMKITALGVFTVNAGANPFTTTKVFTFSTTFNGVANVSVQTLDREWEFSKRVAKAPGTSQFLADRSLTAVDEIHIVVVDEDGEFTGTPGTVVEVYDSLSRATDAKTESGTNNHYVDVINNVSAFVWAGQEITAADIAVAASVSTLTRLLPTTLSLVLGADGANEDTVALSAITAGLDKFRDAADVDVSFILGGKSRGNVLANYITANICEVRKDCIGFFSPEKSDVVNTTDSAAKVVTFRNSLSQNSSYAVMDSGYKYQYDKYNDVFRFIPLNGDTAGTAVRTDQDRDPWFSPAGFTRGQIKNVVRLAFNPSQADRDILYQADVNPIVTFPGQGTVLFGDKTLLGRPSAFDRINVRRLFIVLEKAIAKAAQSFLFEFNNDFTRAQFKNMVEPFLRDVQGRQGITAFKVVADNSNNPGSVIDRNEFVGDIFIQPARSINFITLNFIATRTNVEFSEIVGAV